MRSRRYRWVTKRYDPGTIVPDDVVERFRRYVSLWGYRGDVSDEDERNVLILMRNQLVGKAGYEWNSLLDVEAGILRIPLIGFNSVSADSRYSLGRSGLVQDPEGASFDAISRGIPGTIRSWADISLLYSAGGIADAMNAYQGKGTSSSEQ